MSELPGFGVSKDDDEIIDDVSAKFKKKTPKKSGGFQSMGLGFDVLKGIVKRGYKQPTPIQRKTIPLVLEGRDVVAMARTGSGKTACFLIPMFEKLKIRTAKTGARALILSPTRELALQTLKFVKELGRFTNLKSSIILGGDSMDEQFSAIHGNPDVLVATPGRFLHVCIEMDLKLNSIEYVVFDEADRLFEMGLGEQLTEIVHRLPDSRQTVLFSATLPKVLVNFAKAGLSDPVLIRLDLETKIPSELDLWFILVRPEERVATLLALLLTHIDNKQQTIVFAATKHHVEYLAMILTHVNISNTFIYSNLDPAARKINAAKFATGKVQVLVVTDVAARGIDIPQLDNVINFNFPAKPKLFVHRVGRCARAGRSGTAYSLVAPDEHAHLLDLHLFLGRPLLIASQAGMENDASATTGHIPHSLVEEQHSALLQLHRNYTDLATMQKVTVNAYQQYMRSRPAASADSNRRCKQLPFGTASILSRFRNTSDNAERDDERMERERQRMLVEMKNYRPQMTVFEMCGKKKTPEYHVMQQKKRLHDDKILKHHQQEQMNDQTVSCQPENGGEVLSKSSEADLESAFNSIIVPKKRQLENMYKQHNRKEKRVKKDENYIPYAPSDRHTEEGLSLNQFQNEASKVELELTADDDAVLKRESQSKKWDRKKKKIVAAQDRRVGKIKTESGVWIPATYRSNRYKDWKEKTKVAENDSDHENDVSTGKSGRNSNQNYKARWTKHNEKLQMKQRKSELKTKDQIMKARKIAEKKKSRQKRSGKKSKRSKK